MSEIQRPVAVFDVDGTLFRSNLLVEVVDTLVEQGVFPKKIRKQFDEERRQWKQRRHRASYVKYVDRLIATYLTQVPGLTEQKMQEAVADIMQRAPENVYVYGRELVQELRPTHFLVAISGSPEELVGPFVRSLRFHAFHAAQYETKDGVYTGVAQPGHHNKDLTLRRIVQENNLTFQGSVGMGDTDADISMLSLVARPIAFNPNKELLEHATKSGWEIINEHKDTIYHRKGGIFRQVGNFAHHYDSLQGGSETGERPQVLIVNRCIVSREDGKILLIQRASSDRYAPGFWEFPGGKLDKEDPNEALPREVAEETGLTIQTTSPLVYSYKKLIKEGPYAGVPYISLIGTGRVTGGTVTLSEEHEAYEWVTAEEALQYNTKEEVSEALEALSKQKR